MTDIKVARGIVAREESKRLERIAAQRAAPVDVEAASAEGHPSGEATKRMGSHAATSACACRLPKRAERAVGRMWAARVLGYRLTLLASRRRLLLRAVLGAVVAFVSRPLRPL